MEKENILKEIEEYDIYTINVSSYNYKDNQIYEADIQMCKNGDIYCSLIFNPETNLRDNTEELNFSIKTNILDNRAIKKIPYFDVLLKYIDDHDLYDVLVELSLFDISLGINNEKIIVWELRTHY